MGLSVPVALMASFILLNSRLWNLFHAAMTLICPYYLHTGALTYAELGTAISSSGAEYSYLLEAFGRGNDVGDGNCRRFWRPLPAFLFAWVNMVLLKPAAVAIICLVFSAYCIEPFYSVCSSPIVAQKCLAALCIRKLISTIFL